MITGAVLAGLAGTGAVLFGGRLMGGSLAALAMQFPGARLSLDHLGILGEAAFGRVSQITTAGFAGAMFGAAMVLALTVEQRRWYAQAW